MNDNWKIKIIDLGYTTDRDVYVFRRTPNGTDVLLPTGMITIGEKGVLPSEPTLRLSPEQLQAFADELSLIGYKPLKGFIEGKLDATEKHLQDMRRLVFEEKEITVSGAPMDFTNLKKK